MWTTRHRATTPASPAAVWAALTALHSGTPLGPGSDAFEPHGPLAVGTRSTVTPQGQEPMTSTITEFDPERSYADQTAYGTVLLTFRHEIEATATGGSRVTHTLEVTGEGSERVGPRIGPGISADFPATMTELLAAARRGVTMEA